MDFLYRCVLLVLLLSLPSTALAGDGVPHEIAGIKLGDSIESYPDFEYSNFLKEIVVMDWHGFRKGVISYGICQSPGIIVRLQMKYEDSSKSFFNTLLSRFKNEYGPPHLWEGDSFGIKHIWKWQFTDKEGQRVNMILQHNTHDSNASLGNQVKIYYPEKIEEEHLCFLRMCEEIDDPQQKQRKDELKKSGWEYLIPQ